MTTRIARPMKHPLLMLRRTPLLLFSLLVPLAAADIVAELRKVFADGGRVAAQ